MNKKRRILFTSLFALIIIGICAVCLYFGRGHTIYLDNKTTENGKYENYDSIKVFVKDEKVASMGPRERGAMPHIGQNLKLTVEYRVKSNSSKKEAELSVKIPYNMDGIILNLPALIEGASEDEYLTEFVSKVVIQDDEPTTTEDDLSGAISE